MPQPPKVTTILLIRHAEKSVISPTDQDPHLSLVGKARARLLIHVVGEAGITLIYHSHFIRAKETAQPLATQLGIPTIQVGDPLQIKNDILANHVGETVLVIGHSNTVPDVINQLGAGSVPVIAESKFDNLFVVKKWPPGAASVTRLKYGKKSI